MPLTDTDITDWEDDYTAADTNSPTDSQLINGQLDDEVRNIKSVVRAESRAKEWQRHGLTPTYVSATSFTLAGDKRSITTNGRRLKATMNSRVIYGYVSNSSYSVNTTTVTCVWDLVKFTDAALTIDDENSIAFSGNFANTNYFASNQVVELWNAANQRMPGRFLASDVLYDGIETQISFSFPTYDNAIDFLNFLPTVMLWRGYPAGLNANLSVVEFGPYTPDTFQSGLPHRTVGGTFNVVLNNTVGPFTVNFPINADTGSPIELHTNTYVVQLQPTGIVSGSPNTTAWASAYVSARQTTNFNITLSAAVNAGTVQYDYFISLGN